MKTGVVDSINYGVVKVLLEDEKETVHLNIDIFETKVEEGDIIELEVDGEFVKSVRKNTEKTEESQKKVEELMERLRKKQGSNYIDE